MDKSAAKEDGKDRGAALADERTPGTQDTDTERDTAKDAPEPPRRETEPEKVRAREFEMEM